VVGEEQRPTVRCEGRGYRASEVTGRAGDQCPALHGSG